ncbi:MAG: class I SAM-dependent methyltransferase [Alphaproteobacteria bacterium]|nr:class I SAM-dependent methyltransferase [Alphaproteobacteria bacterium]
MEGEQRGTRRPNVEALSKPIEESVSQAGVTPQSVWLDRVNAVEKGVRRAEAICRMLDRDRDFTIVDIGCGPGLALDFLEDRFGNLRDRYLGVDISPLLIEAARARRPGYRFDVRDILAYPLSERSFDYAIINGVITAKYGLNHDDMETFATTLLSSVWGTATKAMAFNVMSIHVDWMRDDLFHWPMDRAASFCTSTLSRHINILADYGLYEYTVQVFRERRPIGYIPTQWQGEDGA